MQGEDGSPLPPPAASGPFPAPGSRRDLQHRCCWGCRCPEPPRLCLRLRWGCLRFSRRSVFALRRSITIPLLLVSFQVKITRLIVSVMRAVPAAPQHLNYLVARVLLCISCMHCARSS